MSDSIYIYIHLKSLTNLREIARKINKQSLLIDLPSNRTSHSY